MSTQVSPADPPTYWEFHAHAAMAFGGEACADATDPSACQAQLASIEPPSCSAIGCAPYLVVNRGDEIETVVDAGGVLGFLGAIDRPMEAAILALAHGYEWNADSPRGVRATDAGFELIVYRLVAYCLPVVTDRVLLEVTSVGGVTEKRTQHADVDCRSCI